MKDDLFLDPARAGVYFLSQPHWKAAEAAASRAQRQFLVAHLNAGDREAVLRELGTALSFPAWYGANLDALYDCLTDPDWQPVTGQALLISGLNRLKEAQPESFAILTDVFLSAADACRDAGQPLWILLDTPAPALPCLSIA